MTLRHLHRLSALVLAVFLALHLANHLAGLAGQEAHHGVQLVLRRLYRQPLIEPLLLALFALQAVSGLRMALPRLQRLTRLTSWQRWQTLSGLYLAIFLAIHVSAVLTARWQGIETDLAFAATAFQAGGPWPMIFTLYYGAAVMAVGVHLATLMHRSFPVLARITVFSSAGLALVLVLMLAGAVNPISIPPGQIAAFPFLR